MEVNVSVLALDGAIPVLPVAVEVIEYVALCRARLSAEWSYLHYIGLYPACIAHRTDQGRDIVPTIRHLLLPATVSSTGDSKCCPDGEGEA